MLKWGRRSSLMRQNKQRSGSKKAKEQKWKTLRFGPSKRLDGKEMLGPIHGKFCAVWNSD